MSIEEVCDMQDGFVGDVGDFGKYGLLKALAIPPFRLGVIWANNPVKAKNGEGGHTHYPRLRPCDPPLYDTLQSILQTNRRIAAIQSSGILPADTLYYSESLPLPYKGASARQQWMANAAEALRDARLIFFDPDNGLPPIGTEMHDSTAVLYTFWEEVRLCLRSGKSAVIYQHLRRNTVEHQVAEQLPLLRECGSSGQHVLTFNRYAVRIYYLLSATEEHDRLLRQRVAQFVSGPWGRRDGYKGKSAHFEFLGTPCRTPSTSEPAVTISG